MSTKVCFLAIALAIVLLPWLLWQVALIRRIAPLAVMQILVGVALGPSALGQIAPTTHATLFSNPVLAALDGVSSLGVLLYVFVTGLHLDGTILQREGRSLGAMALGSIAVPLILGGGAGLWMLQAIPGALGPLGSGTAFTAAIAICIAVTALPVLAAILQELGLLHAKIGQTALALAALNDAALWVMLAVLLAIAAPGSGAGHLLPLGAAILWFGATLSIGRRLLKPLARAPDQAVLAVGVAFALLSAGVSEALGTGYLIGAFIAGAVLPPPCRATLLARLELITGTVLLPFFFMSTGLKARIEPASANFLGLLAVAVAATVIGKLIGTALPARRSGFSWIQSLSLGAMMQTKGLMEVVVLSTFHDAGLIGTQVFSGMVAMAVICTVITGPAVRACLWLETRSSRMLRDSITPGASPNAIRHEP